MTANPFVLMGGCSVALRIGCPFKSRYDCDRVGKLLAFLKLRCAEVYRNGGSARSDSGSRG